MLAAWLLTALVAIAAPERTPTILFLSDFGVVDDSVAICKGVMLSVAPQARVVDITHEVRPYSILDGARFLAGVAPYYPPGTVMVAVVDPGVGSKRRSIVVKTRKGQFIVGPDNGLLTLVEQQDGIEEVREITNKGWMIPASISSTFHGRDVFSPVAAHLARGDDFRKVGPVVTDAVRLRIAAAQLADAGISGEVIAVEDPYGNLVTNVEAALFLKLGYQPGELVPVTVGTRTIPVRYVGTFSDVGQDEALAYIDSRGRFALAINQGNFADVHQVKPPATITIPPRKPPG